MWKLPLQQQRLGEGSDAGPAAAAVPLPSLSPAVDVPEVWTPLCSKHALISCSGEGPGLYSGCFLFFPSVILWSPAFCGSPEPDHLGLVRGQ